MREHNSSINTCIYAMSTYSKIPSLKYERFNLDITLTIMDVLIAWDLSYINPNSSFLQSEKVCYES